jgi:hypothetical protein
MNIENSVVTRHDQEELRREKQPLCICGSNDVSPALYCSEYGYECFAPCDLYFSELPIWRRLLVKLREPRGARTDCPYSRGRAKCEWCESWVDMT